MGARVLENIEVGNESRAYIDCLYSVLTAAGSFKGPKYLLSGMSGFAFIFSAHRELIVASTEMYGLRTAALNALEILGYYSEIYGGLKTCQTFILHQKMAIERIRESIDKGMGVIVWAPGRTDFAVIAGYDDEDGVFFYRERYNADMQVLLYSNLGRTEATFWMCQVIGESVEKDIKDIYMDSLEYAIDAWETPYIDEVVHNRALASGRKAYEYLIEGLKAPGLNEAGAGRILHHNIISREEACRYLELVKDELPECLPAYVKYKELHDIYQGIRALLPEQPVSWYGYKLDRSKLLLLVECCEEARRTEEMAVAELKLLLKERLSNRYVDILDVKRFR